MRLQRKGHSDCVSALPWKTDSRYFCELPLGMCESNEGRKPLAVEIQTSPTTHRHLSQQLQRKSLADGTALANGSGVPL